MIVGLLKTILILVAVYYMVTFINRYLLNRYARRVQERKTREGKRSEGKVTIESPGKQDKRFPRDEGEYVDYEEIKD